MKYGQDHSIELSGEREVFCIRLWTWSVTSPASSPYSFFHLCFRTSDRYTRAGRVFVAVPFQWPEIAGDFADLVAIGRSLAMAKAQEHEPVSPLDAPPMLFPAAGRARGMDQWRPSLETVCSAINAYREGQTSMDTTSASAYTNGERAGSMAEEIAQTMLVCEPDVQLQY